MTRALPDDREKALEAIANGWGREATPAHPLCTCQQPTPPPAQVPPCDRCGAEAGEKCRQPGPVCGRSSTSRYRRRVQTAQSCPVHGDRP